MVVVIFSYTKAKSKKWQWCSLYMCSQIISLIVRAYKVQAA